jgi:hypothetical protein
VEVPGRDVFEPGALFEVADREFDDGVLTVELVDVDGGAVEVGEEPAVSPVGPQLQLLFVGEACASPRNHSVLPMKAALLERGVVVPAMSTVARLATTLEARWALVDTTRLQPLDPGRSSS